MSLCEVILILAIFQAVFRFRIVYKPNQDLNLEKKGLKVSQIQGETDLARAKC